MTGLLDPVPTGLLGGWADSIQPRDFYPVDPFEAAAERTRRATRSPLARPEGAAMQFVTDMMIPQMPLDVALMALGGP